MAAHQVAAGIQDPETIALTLVNIGDAHRLLGNREEAGRTLLESLGAGRGAGNATLEMTARTELGTLRLETGDHDGAIEQGQAALDIATRCGYRQWIRNAHDVLAVAFENRGDLAKALSHWKAGQEIRTAMLKAQAEEASKSQKLRLELERARHEAEVQRLRHVELARANAELEEAGERLRRSDLEKSALVEQLREKSSLLEQQTKEDALTGLSNRRHLEQVLDHEFQRARRFGRPLTVLLVDIDHFKAINDAHSHAVGDAVLRRVAAVIRGACRAVDAVARYGGDEFVVVLPETGVQEGTRIGERIRRDVEALAAGDSWPSPPPTLSIGVADDSGRTRPGDVVEAADRALYEAKQQGRNQVVVSS
jgi:diguanylate cyclase (GGDEF)-like protein